MTPGMMMPGCPMMGGIAAPAPVPAPAKPGTPMAPGMMMPGCPMMGGMKAPAAPAPAMPGAPMTPGCPMMGGMNPPTPKAPAAPAPGTPVAPPTGMEMLPWSPWMVPGVPGPMPAAPAVTPAPAAPGAPVRMQVREMPHPQAMPGAPMPTAVSHDRNEFKIGAEGKVTATVTRGENTLTIEFKSAEDLRERYPRLFEAFKTMTDGLREPGRR